MVKMVVELSERTNRVINIIKAKYGLRNKSLAVELMVREYEKFLLEPELRPEYVRKLKEIEKEDAVRVKSVGDLDRLLGE